MTQKSVFFLYDQTELPNFSTEVPTCIGPTKLSFYAMLPVRQKRYNSRTVLRIFLISCKMAEKCVRKLTKSDFFKEYLIPNLIPKSL